jgi:hypothetical protein
MTTNKAEKKPNKRINIHTTIMWGMALVQAVRYARAFAIAEIGRHDLTGMPNVDEFLAYASLITGLLMGFGMSLGLAFVASQLRGLKGKKETQWVTGLFMVMLIVSPVVLTPMVKGTMAEWLADILYYPILQWLWAVGVVVLPDALIAAVGFMDRSATLPAKSSDAPATASDAGSDVQRQSATLKSRSAKKPATVSDAQAKIYRCECGQTFADRFKYSGHTRTCAKRKEIMAGKNLIAVELPATPAKIERGGER